MSKVQKALKAETLDKQYAEIHLAENIESHRKKYVLSSWDVNEGLGNLQEIASWVEKEYCSM